MDDLSVQISFKGKSGRQYSFVHHYEIASDVVPGSEGVYVFTKGKTAEPGSLIDIQLLQSKDEIDSTIDRMKQDGALFVFFKECTEKLSCDAEIDDIKGGDEYRRMVE